jgi:predicted HAD superfamily phosphohydrolase
MASLRKLKRDINYLMDEVVTDSYLSLYFHPEHKDAIVGVIREAVDLRNTLYDRANKPAEKRSKSLVRKHYAAVRRDMFTGIDTLFTRLSQVGK